MKNLRRFSVWRFAVLLVVYPFFAGLGAAYSAYVEIAADLPEDLRQIDNSANRATRVYSADGELIGEFYFQKRVEVPLERIPPVVQQAFISAEDRRFWEHPGFDAVGIVRAAYSNWKGTGIKQGASTITQQVTRHIMGAEDRRYQRDDGERNLERVEWNEWKERSYYRKIKEVILSVRFENELSKRDILEMYLNRVYLGHNAYGVQAAAEVYFGKDVMHLSAAEAAMIAGLPQAPSSYSPHRNFKAARTRQRYVLSRMEQDGYITAAQMNEALAEPVALVDRDKSLNHLAAPYFVEHVREWATEKYSKLGVFYGGLRIYTTLDMKAQRSAEAALRDGLEALDRKIGFRGPVGHLSKEELLSFSSGGPQPYLPGLDTATLPDGAELLPEVSYVAAVTKVSKGGTVQVRVGTHERPMLRADGRVLLRWRGDRPERVPGKPRPLRPRLQVGDLLPVRTAVGRRDKPAFTLAQHPEVQAAFVSMDPHSGRIVAMVGGYSFGQSEFNRATQARRQIGSAIKPIIYMTALQNGMNQLQVMSDSPIAVPTASGVWRPKNYTNDYQGAMTLRTALAKSINTISVRLLLRVGLDAFIENLRALGFKSKIARSWSVALGSPDITLLEIVSAYATFANGGLRAPPRFVDLVVADDGSVLSDFRERELKEQVIDPALAYTVADLMKVVVNRGTGRRAQILGRPAGGKTGTSNNHKDAWFVGYTADHLAGVWVGRDGDVNDGGRVKPIGARATGGSAALPIWVQYMRAAHPDTPVRDFEVPDDVVFVRADEFSGAPAPPGTRGTWIPFVRGTVPPRLAGKAVRRPFDRSVPLSEIGAEDDAPVN